MSRGRNSSIQSLDRAVSILEELANDQRGMQLTDLAERVELNASTVHHLLATFRTHGWVDQDERSKAYRLGGRLIGLVTTSLRSADIYSLSIDAIRNLRDSTQETTYLTRCEGFELVPGIEMLGLQPIQCRREVRPGQSVLHSTASGKVLMAFLSESQREELLPSLPLTEFTPHTIATLPSLETELGTIKKQGFALDREENIVGVSCVAAPVLDQYGSCVATTSVAFPSTREAFVERYMPLVVNAAQDISRRLGFTGSYPALRQESISSS